MSARQIRRAFAAPFVVTLAGAASIATASSGCTKKPAPLHQNPPGPHHNPPAPDPKKDEPMPDPSGGGTGSNPDEQPKMGGNGPKADTADSTPKREPAKFEHRWTVSKIKGNADCQAFLDPNCPKPEPGKAVPTCNPPPPFKYACPDGFKDGDTLKIVLRAGATECFVDRGPMKCPEGAKCNPPPPRKIACPQR